MNEQVRPAIGVAASRRRRLALAYGYLGVVALGATSALIGGGAGGVRGAAALVQVVLLVLLVAVWFSLRAATRLVADEPSEGAAAAVAHQQRWFYAVAHQLLSVAVLAMSVVLVVASGDGVGQPAALALAWVGVGLALGLAPVVAAVQLP